MKCVEAAKYRAQILSLRRRSAGALFAPPFTTMDCLKSRGNGSSQPVEPFNEDRPSLDFQESSLFRVLIPLAKKLDAVLWLEVG